MTNQTYLLRLIDKDENVVDFYRFSCKKLDTVLKKFKEFYLKTKDYGFMNYDKIVKIIVHKTDYEATLDNIVYSGTLKDFE